MPSASAAYASSDAGVVEHVAGAERFTQRAKEGRGQCHA